MEKKHSLKQLEVYFGDAKGGVILFWVFCGTFPK